MGIITDIPGLRIRQLSPADAQELSYIELQIFPTPWSENSLRSCLELSNVDGEAALVDDSIIGYFFAQYAADEAHILNVGIIKDYRRMGIATFLLERFIKRAKAYGAETCYLEVRSGNRSAQQMYFNQGFMPVSVRKQYYPNGEDAIILMKQL